MNLAVDVDTGEGPRTVEIGTTLADPEDLTRVVGICGREALVELVGKGWNAEAAKAVVYVNLVKTLNGGEWPEDPVAREMKFFAYEDMRLDWGDLEPFMVEPDWDMEADLAAMSESLGEV